MTIVHHSAETPLDLSRSAQHQLTLREGDGIVPAPPSMVPWGMPSFPTLSTERLHLRQFLPTDAPRVKELAGAKEVAAGTLLPHPYEDGTAEEWMATQDRNFESGAAIYFAVTLVQNGALIGSIGLEIAREHRQARLSYWLGMDYWRQGFATEAVTAVLAYGFDQLDLNRIYAPHFSGNDASGRVLQKAGMTYEGRMREHYLRFGRFVDLDLYGMLRREFMQRP
jgi:[ribosomal protein S5]-alanine N-acetyltransferase